MKKKTENLSVLIMKLSLMGCECKDNVVVQKVLATGSGSERDWGDWGPVMAFTPFTPRSDQFQLSPAVSTEIHSMKNLTSFHTLLR